MTSAPSLFSLCMNYLVSLRLLCFHMKTDSKSKSAGILIRITENEYIISWKIDFLSRIPLQEYYKPFHCSAIALSLATKFYYFLRYVFFFFLINFY